VQRLAVRDDHTLERQVEQRTQRGQDALLVPRRRPDEELALGRSERVREDKSPVLRHPDRRLVPAAPVVEGDEPARQLRAGQDGLELRLRDVVAEEEIRAERACAVAPSEEVDVAHVIGLEHDNDRRRSCLEPLPDVVVVGLRRERVEEDDLALRLDARRGDDRPPIPPGTPVRILALPQPQAVGDVADLGHRNRRTRRSGSSDVVRKMSGSRHDFVTISQVASLPCPRRRRHRGDRRRSWRS
jgi:hypothetical protein